VTPQSPFPFYVAVLLVAEPPIATEPQSFTEVTMKTRVQKLGPGSWVVFVNDQRHHEIFLTRAAARREAKRQREVNVSHTTIARLEGDHNSIR
jgi:sarcosine oxidase gamma subunit